MAKNINKNNAAHSIVFEAIALALALDADAQLLEQVPPPPGTHNALFAQPHLHAALHNNNWQRVIEQGNIMSKQSCG